MAKRRNDRAKKSGQIGALGAVLCSLVILLGVFVLYISMTSTAPERVAAVPKELSAQVLARPEEPQPIVASDPTLEPTPDPTPEPTPKPTPIPSPTPKSARIRFAGDLVIHQNVLDAAYIKATGEYDFSPMLEYISASLADADYTLANVDGALCGDAKKAYSGYPNFNTPPQLIKALLDSGVDMLTLGNNHALDMYFDGLKGSIANCEAYGMAFVGGARTREEMEKPVIVDVQGIPIAFINYTQSANRMDQRSSPDASEYGIRFLHSADFAKDIRAARNAGAAVVVVYAHWGTEYRQEPDSTQKKYAQAIADAGADVIIGGHPHTIQPAQWLETTRADGSTGRTLVLYSLGNFLAEQRSALCDAGLIFEFTVRQTSTGYEICDPKYVPTYICRTGNSKYFYRTVACGEWLEAPPEGMSAGIYKKVMAGWAATVEHMGVSVPEPTER